MKNVLIIAEAGVNHNGDIELAKRLVDVAHKAGADIVKFQTFNVKSLVAHSADMAEYQKANLGVEEPQETMLKELALSQEEFIILADYCKECGIQFLSTPFDIESVHFLDSLQNIWKIPSGEITNYPYLVEIAKTGKDVYLSTGMSTMEEVNAALKVLKENGAGEITLMHCTTDYPTPMRDVNLKAMQTMQENFGCCVGYSDHTQGIEISIAAVAMGATVIEKHFTLNRNMKGPDHRASSEPEELTALVQAIRNIEVALGDGKKVPSAMEKVNMDVVRKSIIAAGNIKKGELFTEENLTTKRPGTGISPMRWRDVIGRRAVRDFAEDDLIEL